MVYLLFCSKTLEDLGLQNFPPLDCASEEAAHRRAPTSGAPLPDSRIAWRARRSLARKRFLRLARYTPSHLGWTQNQHRIEMHLVILYQFIDLWAGSSQTFQVCHENLGPGDRLLEDWSWQFCALLSRFVICRAHGYIAIGVWSWDLEICDSDILALTCAISIACIPGMLGGTNAPSGENGFRNGEVQNFAAPTLQRSRFSSVFRFVMKHLYSRMGCPLMPRA